MIDRSTVQPQSVNHDRGNQGAPWASDYVAMMLGRPKKCGCVGDGSSSRLLRLRLGGLRNQLRFICHWIGSPNLKSNRSQPLHGLIWTCCFFLSFSHRFWECSTTLYYRFFLVFSLPVLSVSLVILFPFFLSLFAFVFFVLLFFINIFFKLDSI